jgi:hypothetical protein
VQSQREAPRDIERRLTASNTASPETKQSGTMSRSNTKETEFTPLIPSAPPIASAVRVVQPAMVYVEAQSESNLLITKGVPTSNGSDDGYDSDDVDMKGAAKRKAKQERENIGYAQADLERIVHKEVEAAYVGSGHANIATQQERQAILQGKYTDQQHEHLRLKVKSNVANEPHPEDPQYLKAKAAAPPDATSREADAFLHPAGPSGYHISKFLIIFILEKLVCHCCPGDIRCFTKQSS